MRKYQSNLQETFEQKEIQKKNIIFDFEANKKMNIEMKKKLPNPFHTQKANLQKKYKSQSSNGPILIGTNQENPQLQKKLQDLTNKLQVNPNLQKPPQEYRGQNIQKRFEQFRKAEGVSPFNPIIGKNQIQQQQPQFIQKNGFSVKPNYQQPKKQQYKVKEYNQIIMSGKGVKIGSNMNRTRTKK